jgi:hypothetical protein
MPGTVNNQQLYELLRAFGTDGTVEWLISGAMNPEDEEMSIALAQAYKGGRVIAAFLENFEAPKQRAAAQLTEALRDVPSRAQGYVAPTRQAQPRPAFMVGTAPSPEGVYEGDGLQTWSGDDE